MIAFYLKKTVAFFIQPFGMILTLFIVGLFFLFFKKDKVSKIFLSLSFFFLVLFSYPPFVNMLVLPLENNYPKYQYAHKIKYIHVLGGGFNADFSQPISSNLAESALKRVLEGVVIYKQNPDAKMIFTGYKGCKNIAGAIMNSKLALALGVKEKDIIISTIEKDTKEEARFTKSILAKGDEFVLVTSATHLPRAMFLFESVGLKPIPAPTDFRKYIVKSYLRMPDVEYLKISQMAIHEYIGLLWSRLST